MSGGERSTVRVDGFHSLALAYRGRESQVYRAISARVDAPVALKVMNNAAGFDEILRVRDLGTAQGVVPLLDVARTASGESVKVMPFYPDGSYTDILERSGPVHPREVVRVGRAVAGALSVMHSRGLLHNEIVPSNILRASSSAVLTDFGSTAEIGAPPPKLRTSSELVYHAPPEVLRGMDTSPASDIYELASVLWTLLAGHAPFSGDNAAFLGPQEYAANALKTPPAPVRRRDVPWRLNNVLLRALAKDPAERYATPSEFAVELERTWTERPDAAAAAPSAPAPSASTGSSASSAPAPPTAPSGPTPSHAPGRTPQTPPPESPQPTAPRPEAAGSSGRPTGPQTPPQQHASARPAPQPSAPQAPAAPSQGAVPPSGPQAPMTPPSPMPPATPQAPTPAPAASQPSGPHAGTGPAPSAPHASGPQAPVAPQPPVAPPPGPQGAAAPPAAPPAAPQHPYPQPAQPQDQATRNPHPAPEAPPGAPPRPIDPGPGEQVREPRHAAGPPVRPAAPEPVQPTPPEPAPTAPPGGSLPRPPAPGPTSRPAKSSHLAENTGVHNLLERIRGEASAELVAEHAWSRLEGWRGSADAPPLPGLPGTGSSGAAPADRAGGEDVPDFSDPGPVQPPRWRRHLHIVAAAASIIVITGAAGGLSVTRPGPGLSTSNAQAAELLPGGDSGQGKEEQEDREGKEDTEGEKGDGGSATTEKKSEPLPEVAAPSNVSVQDNLSSVQVQWTDKSGGKASYFVVGGATYEDPKTLVRTGAGVTVAQVTTDDTVAEYCFTVVAVDGRSAAAPEVCTNRAGARAEAEAERKRKEEEEKKKEEEKQKEEEAADEDADTGADTGSDSKSESSSEKKSSG
ncbi:protein kinase [Nocardiopsis rhodophaea]